MIVSSAKVRFNKIQQYHHNTHTPKYTTPTTMHAYQNAPQVLSIPNDDSDTSMTNDNMTRPAWWSGRSKSVLVVLGAFAVACIVALVNRSTPAAFATTTPVVMDTTSVLASSSTTTTTACTFDECYATRCNSKVAPFTCVFHNGGPHGGCSLVPWTDESCTKSCDLTNCDDLEIPSDTKSCDEPCDADWCAAGRLCGPDVPYQCTGGASTYGCSSDKFQWTLLTTSTACSSCCDISNC